MKNSIEALIGKRVLVQTRFNRLSRYNIYREAKVVEISPSKRSICLDYDSPDGNRRIWESLDDIYIVEVLD